MSMCVCRRLVYELANMGNLSNGVILRAQINVGFYGHPVCGAPSCADGLEGYGLLWCQGGIVISCNKYYSHSMIMLPLFRVES